MDFYWIQMVSKQWGSDFDKSEWDSCDGIQAALSKGTFNYEHGGTRTPDSQNRNLMLYPTELHAHKTA